MTILEAQQTAHKMAFYPITFQAIRALLKFKLLEIIATADNANQASLVAATGLSPYAVNLLLDVSQANDIVTCKDHCYAITKLGKYLLENEDVHINMDFMHAVCYNGAFYLDEALENGTPAGLKVFGAWPTIYEGLGKLPEAVNKSWFDFDNHYSDLAFKTAVPIVLKDNPRMVYDIGGNTAKFDIALLNANAHVKVTIFDLESQLEKSRANMERAGLSYRAAFKTINMLDTTTVLPLGADAVWMSQFLDCFSPEQIIAILRKVYDAAGLNTRIYIMEPFIDMQNEVATLTLLNISLYFTCMANGNSRMYKQSDMLWFLEQAGCRLIQAHQHIGPHDYTILECMKA